MKNVLVIIILISFKITAQISEAPGLALPLNNPKNHYQELVNTYLNPNRNNEFNHNNYSFNYTDFDLKKEKIVKKISIDNNSDGINEYHLSFNPKGKIVLCEDLLRNYTMTYEYFENLIIVTKTDRNSNYKNIVQSAEIDSIFFDKNENIIKHSFTMKVSEKFGKNYKRIVVENQFSKDNKLEKKYYSSIDHINIPLEEVRETVYQNYKDSIVEKDYYIYKNKLSASDTITYKNNFVSKSVYYLNQNNKIFRITNFGQDFSLNIEVFINYDEFGKITEFLSSRGSSGYFKYNSKGNITSIRQTLGKNEDFQYDCIYDNHDRFISAETDGKKIKEFERNYTYDKYGNWVTLTFMNTDDTTTRTIIYY